jgi:DNA polymerase
MSQKRTARTTGSAADFIPPRPTLTKLRAAVQDCRGCDLYACATQAVFGEGPRAARIMFVGEQPGDAEDRQGHPFVGPSGRLLDRAFDKAGIAREDVYLTNAVKHFKWAKDSRSSRRLHKTPNAGETRACAPWLAAEIAVVRPRVIVCLGAIAAKSLLGRTFSVMKQRGVAIESPHAEVVFATVHPSAVLRAPDDQRAIAERLFVADLRRAARYLEKPTKAEKRARVDGRTFASWSTTENRSATSNGRIRSSRR